MPTFSPAALDRRPAHVASEPEYAYQRRFGSDSNDAYRGSRSADNRSSEEFAPAMAAAAVYRDGKTDLAELQIDMGLHTCARFILRLDTAQLRDLSARLLDAAHDIEANPAAVLAQSARASAGVAS
ncbi:hypothetical protein [Variovorax sp. 278MFTsu5.1]|uniref:hypothetical protein n=1 Tax=Variovorax sp. 278MFTsu5.1 TaxID=3158366 RepID=UPI003AB094CD